MSIDISSNSAHHVPHNDAAAPVANAGDRMGIKLAAYSPPNGDAATAKEKSSGAEDTGLVPTEKPGPATELHTMLCQARTAIFNTLRPGTPSETEERRALAYEAITRVQNKYPNWRDQMEKFDCPPTQ